MLKSCLLVAIVLLTGSVVSQDTACEESIKQFFETIESKRIEACRLNGGHMVPVSILAPALDGVSTFLQKQPEQFKDVIPKSLVNGFESAHRFLRNSRANLCDNNQIRLAANIAKGTLRQVPNLDTAVQQFCEAYKKYMETEQGKQFAQQLSQLWDQALALAAQPPVESNGEPDLQQE